MQQKLIVLNSDGIIDARKLWPGRPVVAGNDRPRYEVKFPDCRRGCSEISGELFHPRRGALHSSLHRSSILPTDNCSYSRYLYSRDSLVHTGLATRTGFHVRYFASSTKFRTESDSTRIKSEDEKMILSLFSLFVYYFAIQHYASRGFST